MHGIVFIINLIPCTQPLRPEAILNQANHLFEVYISDTTLYVMISGIDLIIPIHFLALEPLY